MGRPKKPGFIKVKHKDFPKYFPDKNIDKIWDFFLEHFNDVKGIKIDWEETIYTNMIKGTVNIPLYPETDKWDDTEGIQPKQIFEIIDLIGFENFKKVAKILSKNIAMFVNNAEYFELEDEGRNETIISWKKVVKDKIMPFVKEEDIAYFGKLIFCDSLGVSNMGTTYSKAQFPYDILDEVFKAIIADELEVEAIMFFKTNKIYDSSEKLTLTNLNADSFFKNRETEWEKVHDFIPKSKSVLLLDPNYWDKKVFLESMNILYGTRQLDKLIPADQNDFITFYKSFGKLLIFIAPMLNNEHIHKPSQSWPVLYRNDIPNGLRKILVNLGRGIDIRMKVEDILFMYATMSTFKDSDEFISKKAQVSIDDVYLLVSIGREIANINDSDMKKLKDIPWRHIGVFKKYNVSNNKAVLDLYAATKDIKCDIPLVSGRVGKYSYEVLSKNDIRGLIAGNAMNCCQHIPSGIGKSCVYYGAEHKNSTFFIINDDKGNIVCQSWLWEKENILVCDSAETLRRDEDFYNIYMEMAEKIVNDPNNKIKEVRIGSYGRAFGQNLPNASSNVSIPSVPGKTKFDYGRSGSLYSDASHQKLLYKK